jgi:large subunit ribosomal protein L23
MALFGRKSKKEPTQERPKEERKALAVSPTVLKTVATGGTHTLAIRRPHISERASDEAAKGVYVFEVAPHATKPEIRAAVAALFKVTPIKIRTVTKHAKTIMMKGRPGTRRGGKKAYVYLKKGEKIEIV